MILLFLAFGFAEGRLVLTISLAVRWGQPRRLVDGEWGAASKAKSMAHVYSIEPLDVYSVR